MKPIPPITTDPPTGYVAFMLRGWNETTQQGVIWRFSLEDPHTGQRLGFMDLTTLLTFIQNKLDAQR